ncbi:hypothetical protein ACFLVO_02795 [Chloroflexota bacterium]
MKKILAITLAIILALVPTLTVMAADMDTEAVVGGGSGNSPYVCAKFETPDHSEEPGTQIEPVAGGKRVVKFYVVIGDSNGVDDLSAAYIKVYHPDGSFKFQLDAIRPDWTLIPYDGLIDMDGDCVGETPVPEALDMLEAQGRITYGFDPVRDAMMDLGMLKYDIEHGKQLLVELVGEMDYCQPSGDYRVEAIAVDQNGKAGTLENYFYYISIVALRCDFTSVNWGNVNVSQWNVLYGDEDMGTPTKPTIHNIGNDPAKIELHFTEMIGDNYYKKISDFDALMLDGHIELVACTPEVITNAAGEPVMLPACTPTQIDFSVHPPTGTPEDTYRGQMTITIMHLVDDS